MGWQRRSCPALESTTWVNRLNWLGGPSKVRNSFSPGRGSSGRTGRHGWSDREVQAAVALIADTCLALA